MSSNVKKILSYVLFSLSFVLTIAGFSVASKPSVMPIASVMGAFAIPALLFWWGLILYKSSKKSEN
jgi:hypothetical protein